MLKLKDNVDFEELKKYGFEKGIDTCCQKALVKDLGDLQYIAVYDDRSIYVDVIDLMCPEEELKEVKELIEAGIVEKE